MKREIGRYIGGAIIGGGVTGKTAELDNDVRVAARLLEEAYHRPVTIRYNTNRCGGGAYIVGGKSDSSVGIGVTMQEGKKNEYRTCIDLTETENSVNENSQYILIDAEFRPAASVQDAIAYLRSMVLKILV